MNITDSTPKIFHIASLWTLSGYGDSNGEWSIEKKLDLIKEAGFDGFAGRVPQVPKALVVKHNLLFAAIVDIGEESDTGCMNTNDRNGRTSVRDIFSEG